jgi:hypothetical protein
MNFDGCKRKFDVQRYINNVNALDPTSPRALASKAALRNAAPPAKASKNKVSSRVDTASSEDDEKPAKKLKTK